MKVAGKTSPRPLETVKKAPVSRSNRAGLAFSVPASDSHLPAAGSLSGPNTVMGVDSLLAVQSVDGDTQGQKRRKAVGRAEQLLDILDEIKISLLTGGVPVHKLDRLLGIVSQQRTQVVDPVLTDLLDHIELRAQVELAKFGH